MKKFVLTFGLIAGALMAAMMLLPLPFHDQLGPVALIVSLASAALLSRRRKSVTPGQDMIARPSGARVR